MKTLLRLWMLVVPMALALTSCSSDDDNNKNTWSGRDTNALIGTWYSDGSASSNALWNYGPIWDITEFKADGTGETMTYYIDEDGTALGYAKKTFTYEAKSDGTITMTLDYYGQEIPATSQWAVVGNELRIEKTAGGVLVMNKVEGEMAKKVDAWNKADRAEMIEVPKPAHYTVFVYGNAGGRMDIIIEKGFWERTKQYLTDHDNVRVVCMYKYGKQTSSEVTQDGDIVWFELTDTTHLSSIREDGMQIIGMGDKAKKMKICDPNTLRMFMEVSSLLCPASEYIFTVWGHGSGFDPLGDYPKKYEVESRQTRGVIYDEWNNAEELDMYEFKQAIEATGVGKLNAIFFHNCMMGNMETLTEIKDMADYLVASEHILSSDGILVTEFVRGLIETNHTEGAFTKMLQRANAGEGYDRNWPDQYKDEGGEKQPNGDFKLIRTSDFDAILDATKKLSARLVALYPTQKEAIDRATLGVYRCVPVDLSNPGLDGYVSNPFFDLADYARLCASATNDEELKAISTEMDKAFEKAFIRYQDVNWNEQHLDHYTLSVCLYDKQTYASVMSIDGSQRLRTNYELSSFHNLTQWGKWLLTNEKAPWGNPMSEGGEPLQ